MPRKIVVHFCFQVFSQTDLGPILRRFAVVTVDQLPPAPARMDEDAEEGGDLIGLDLEELSDREFGPPARQVMAFKHC